MQVCRELTAAQVKIELVDDNGLPLIVASVSYSVLDSSGTSVVPLVMSNNFIYGDSSVVIDIPDTVNTLDFESDGITKKRKDYKTISVVADLESGSQYTIFKDYIVSTSLFAKLVVMENSYQMLVSAEMLAMDMSLDAWKMCSDVEKSSAMIEAYGRLGLYQYNVPVPVVYSSELPYVPLKTKKIVNVNMMSASDFCLLDSLFLKAIKTAQVYEADAILKHKIMPSDYRDKISQGVTMEKVGDSYIALSKSKELSLSLSRNTLKALSQYVDARFSIGRT